MNRLKEKYRTQIKPELQSELEISTPMDVIGIEKIVVNCGVGRATQDSKHLDAAVETLTQITAQKPIVTKAKHSIAAFKLRETNAIGAKVTLRDEYMWNFLDRVISIVIPRTRDFRGLSLKGFDQNGNYSIGFADQTVFPELSYEDSSTTHGLQMTIVTTKKDNKEAELLLRKLGFPLEKGK